MDTNDIQARIDEMVRHLEAKGSCKPTIEYSITNNLHNRCYIRHRCIDGVGMEAYKYEFFKGDADSIFAEASDYISELRIDKDENRKRYQAAIRKAIDLGKELGQDVEALAAEVRRISNNALTDQSGGGTHG